MYVLNIHEFHEKFFQYGVQNGKQLMLLQFSTLPRVSFATNKIYGWTVYVESIYEYIFMQLNKCVK